MPSNRSLVVTPDAEADIRSILRYTRATWGDAQRRTYAATLETTLARLAEFRSMGKRRDELAVGLRSHAVGEHIIFYRVTDESLIIRRVVHRLRDVESLSNV